MPCATIFRSGCDDNEKNTSCSIEFTVDYALKVQQLSEFKLYLGGTGTVLVDWGDGNTENLTLVPCEIEYLAGEYMATKGKEFTHTYATDGTYTVKISSENSLNALDLDQRETNDDVLNPNFKIYDISHHNLTEVIYLNASGVTMHTTGMNKIILYSTETSEYNSFTFNNYPTLKELTINYSYDLHKLNLSNNPNLQVIYASYCDLSSIDISNCPSLDNIFIAFNYTLESDEEAMNNLYNGLPTITNGKGTITVSTDPIGNSEVATNKGWEFENVGFPSFPDFSDFDSSTRSAVFKKISATTRIRT